MTSEERREKRYQNRKNKRNAKRVSRLSRYDNYENIISCAALYHGYKQSRKTIAWKNPVQRYEMNELKYTCRTHADLVREKDITQGFIEFDICERGKLRHIKSVHFRERCVQRSLCDNALVPVLSNSLIYDNGASIKGRGIHFAFNRVKAHLSEYYRSNGSSNAGYVLLIDLSKYFDNILHEPIYDTLGKSFSDKRIVDMCRTFIEPFGEKSVGIGSQVSQIVAVSYPNHIDHYIKQNLGIRFYGRYMDDSYLIHESKEYLQQCRDRIAEMYANLGISVNVKKTRIVKLSRGFTFLKSRYFLTDIGHVLVKPCRSSITRMRRKLKKLNRLYMAGSLSVYDVLCSYNSWRGYISHTNSYRTVQSMNALFYKIFKTIP